MQIIFRKYIPRRTLNSNLKIRKKFKEQDKIKEKGTFPKVPRFAYSKIEKKVEKGTFLKIKGTFLKVPSFKYFNTGNAN